MGGEKAIIENERLGESCAQQITASESIGTPREERCIVVIVKEQQMCASDVWFVKVFHLLSLELGRGYDAWEVAFYAVRRGNKAFMDD